MKDPLSTAEKLVSMLDVLRNVSTGLRLDAERDFLMKAGWIPLGAEAGTGIDSWTTLERGLQNVVSREIALKLAGFTQTAKQAHITKPEVKDAAE